MIEEIKKIPKVELHLHLDGSVRLETASRLSGLSLEEVREKMVAPDKCKDLNEYLTKFDFPISLMQTKENLKLIASELALSLHKQNVIYAEVRFAPFFHTKKGLTEAEVVEAVMLGMSEVPIKINLILCLMRGATFEENLKVIEIAKLYLNKGVGGVDLAGAEAIYPTSEYALLFKKIKEENIPFTIHAGEASGPQSIELALDFGAKRIGHGIRCLESENLLKRIIDNNILLEICPTSNVQTNVVSEYQKHPILTLYKSKVHLCINTDNATVSNVSLTDEYIKLYQSFGFSLEEFKRMNVDALKQAFLNEKMKAELIKKIQVGS